MKILDKLPADYSGQKNNALWGGSQIWLPILFALFASSAGADETTYRLSNGRVVVPLDEFTECAQCPVMKALPLGSFMMGAKLGEALDPFDFYRENATFTRRDFDEINIIPSEHPRHPVEIDVPFAIGINEVTFAEWSTCFDSGYCSHMPDRKIFTRKQDGTSGYVNLPADSPVVNVSYLDIQEYTSWLNILVGQDVYRLPSEAEWEYAARAGTETRFAQGDLLSAQQANFWGEGTKLLFRDPPTDLPSRMIPVPVHVLDAANQWGIRHMSGNVSERTLSCRFDQHLSLSKSSEYLRAAMTIAECHRVSKGGSFTGSMDNSRIASRGSGREMARLSTSGFRVIRVFKTEG